MFHPRGVVAAALWYVVFERRERKGRQRFSKLKQGFGPTSATCFRPAPPSYTTLACPPTHENPSEYTVGSQAKSKHATTEDGCTCIHAVCTAPLETHATPHVGYILKLAQITIYGDLLALDASPVLHTATPFWRVPK